MRIVHPNRESEALAELLAELRSAMKEDGNGLLQYEIGLDRIAYWTNLVAWGAGARALHPEPIESVSTDASVTSDQQVSRVA